MLTFSDQTVIDTHCHIDLYESPLEVAQAAERARITTIAVTYLPSHYRQAKNHLGSFRFVRPALGLHPLAAKDHANELRLFCELINDTALIGEIGLDFSNAGKDTRSVQESSFEVVVEKLREKQAFVTVHSRSAEDEVMNRLATRAVGPVVFHWFSGSKKQLLRLLDSGHYVSFNPAMIRTAKWQQLIKIVPKRAVLTESDGPFVRCDGRPARPQHMDRVLEWLASTWANSVDEVSSQVAENFYSLAPEFRSLTQAPMG